MKPALFSHLRSSLLALGVLAGLSMPAAAAPFQVAAPVGQSASGDAGELRVTPVRGDGRWGGNGHRRHHSWNNNRWSRGNWNRGNWNHNNWYRHHRRGHYYGSGIYFGLGIPSYGYIEPSYRYVEPRRIYRGNRLSEAHIEWCYDRWRSYRAYDNTYQPNYGRRRQCWSPYS